MFKKTGKKPLCGSYRLFRTVIFAVLLLLVTRSVRAEQVMGISDTGSLSIQTDEGLSNEEAAEAYIHKVLDYQPNQIRSLRKAASATSKLNETGRSVYNCLKTLIEETAQGKHASTEFTIPFSSIYKNPTVTAEDLGLSTILEGNSVSNTARQLFQKYMDPDMEKVFYALLADYPYDLYWFDKTEGMEWEWRIGSGAVYRTTPCGRQGNNLCVYDYLSGYFVVKFYVAQEYSIEKKTETCGFNTPLGQAITKAGNKIAAVIEGTKTYSTWDRLKAYKDRICEYVDYNEETSHLPYGDPWQLVWIFDDDPETKVVCEGYSKGFKYLCDLTWPSDSEVSCICVTGDMWVNNGSKGGHMWNIVTLHGTNYLADITNCDTGAIGSTDKLFLKGFSGKTGDGAYFYRMGDKTTLYYKYDPVGTQVFTDLDLDLDDDLLGVNNGSFVSGTCGAQGNNIRWTWNPGSGVMMLTGTGDMADYGNHASRPWEDYTGKMVKLVIDQGISGIGQEAFRDCAKLRTVVFRGNVTVIGRQAFAGCPELLTGGKGRILISSCSASYLREWAGVSNGFTYSVTHDTLVRKGSEQPTCTESGWENVWICKACGETIRSDEIPKTGHRSVRDPAVEATCTKAGLTEGSHCSVCGKILQKQEPVAAKGHRSVRDAAVKATCTAAGLTEGSHCSVCGIVLQKPETVPAKGHKTVHDAAVEATCTAAGLTEGSHCSVCGAVITKQETIPAKGHRSVLDPAVPATSSTTGLTEGSHCSVCGTVLVAQKTIPKLSEGEGTNTASEGGGSNTASEGEGAYTASDGARYEIHGGKAVYQEAGGQAASIRIPDTIKVNGKKITVTAIADGAFSENHGVTSIVIGKNIQTIGDSAFSHCSKLKKVKGGAGVTRIGDYAFSFCSSLRSLPDFPKLKIIGNEAFAYCIGLKSFTLSTGVRQIGLRAFDGCARLKKLVIRTKKLTAKRIGENAFRDVFSGIIVQCPKAKQKNYKKILRKKGLPKGAEFKPLSS